MRSECVGVSVIPQRMRLRPTRSLITDDLKFEYTPPSGLRIP